MVRAKGESRLTLSPLWSNGMSKLYVSIRSAYMNTSGLPSLSQTWMRVLSGMQIRSRTLDGEDGPTVRARPASGGSDDETQLYVMYTKPLPTEVRAAKLLCLTHFGISRYKRPTQMRTSLGYGDRIALICELQHTRPPW